MTRIDKWLWSTRLAKTRSQAAKECAAGKIKRDGVSLKPAATIRPGDLLEVPSADGLYKRKIEVLQLLEKRVSAPLAREAYLDHTPEEVLAVAKQKAADLKENRHQRQLGDQGRLTKKGRRLWQSQIHRFDPDA